LGWRRPGVEPAGAGACGAGPGENCGSALDVLGFYGYIAMNAMSLLSIRQYRARAAIAKALAHPSRLLMLDALLDGEKCVCELTELVGADQSTVSKHLSVLKHAGLVEDRKQGCMTYYRVKCRCLNGFFACMENVLQANLRAQQEMVARR